ncbi:MazG nucleotide pyrophosphohydrolase domain-containing protein [Natronorarus salvus]|uniref:MazG nucleotide pyrophosphohydrolase domain-containing protein n=1 Tax=Natronorarus salvus TaxID=3117733 RepID=UPI002F266405
MDEQETVAAFVEAHDIDSDPEYWILDLVAEVGEVASDATRSTRWGEDPDAIEVKPDEIGDAYFSLLATAESLGIDASEALAESLAKYESRVEETGNASSGER